MKIVDKRSENGIRFGAIKSGECFIDDGDDISIKVINYDTGEASAVCLTNGMQWFPCATDEYEVVVATLEIK